MVLGESGQVVHGLEGGGISSALSQSGGEGVRWSLASDGKQWSVLPCDVNGRLSCLRTLFDIYIFDSIFY